MRPDEREELLASYALGALSGPEADEVEALVRGDLDAARQLAAYREIADLIGLESLRPTDPALRRRMLRAARRIRPPLRRRFPLPLRAAAALAAIAVLAAAIGWGVRLQRAVGDLERGAADLGSVVAADARRIDALDIERVGGGDEALRQELQAALEAQQRMIAVLADPAVREASLTGASAARGASGRYLWSAELGAGVVIARRLPPLPLGAVYELWLIEGFREVSGGTFLPNADGDAQVLVELDLDFDPRSVAIIPAPAGGSAGRLRLPVVLAGSIRGDPVR